MAKSKRWRTIVAGLAFIAMVVIALNIETLAAKFGFDRILIGVVEAGPAWIGNIVDALTSDTAVIISVAVVFYAAGLWSDSIGRRLLRIFSRPVNFEKLAADCERIAPVLRISAPLFNMEGRYTLYLQAELIDIQSRIYKLGIYKFIDRETKEDAMKAAETLELLAPTLRLNDIEAARKILVERHRRGPRADRIKF